MALSLYDTIRLMQPSEARDGALKQIERHTSLRWENRRRPDQVPPQDIFWSTWIYVGGRGAGKTRTGAEFVNEYAENHKDARILMVARTAADVREVMVEGESGILAINPTVKYSPSIRRLVWPNGAQAFVTSADEPDSIRGVDVELTWGDEVANWRRGKKDKSGVRKNDAWDNLCLATRKGWDPKIIVTTTPSKTKMLKKLHKLLVADPLHVRLTQVDTRANFAALHPNYLDAIEGLYEGSNLAEQELRGNWPWKL